MSIPNFNILDSGRLSINLSMRTNALTFYSMVVLVS